MGYRGERKPGVCFPILGTAVSIQGSKYLCFLESLYVCKCWKTDALMVPAFLLVIVKDCSNTLPGELS